LLVYAGFRLRKCGRKKRQKNNIDKVLPRRNAGSMDVKKRG